MKLEQRSLRDELAFLLDSTVDLPAYPPHGYDRDTLLMRLEAAVEFRVSAALAEGARLREALDEAADMWPRPNKYDAILASSPLSALAAKVIEAALHEADRIRGKTNDPTQPDQFLAAADALNAERAK